MDKDDFIEWLEDNYHKLAECFAEKHDYMFDEFCMNEYESMQQSRADAMLDSHKDSLAEDNTK